MATWPKQFPMSAQEHDYHAEAHALSGDLKLPVHQEIQKQAAVMLNDWRGGHFFQRIDRYSLEGVISFQSGYTHVSGNPSQKKDHGWVTLATSVVEGLNVLDVITADRMIAQVSTEHPPEEGYVPNITFLGTRFENLRVGGHEVKLELNLGICGDKPKGDKSYLSDQGFLKRVKEQRSDVWDDRDLPTTLRDAYDGERRSFDEIRKNCSSLGKEEKRVKCSLVESIEPIPGVKILGNLLQIPGFGTVTLAELEVGVKPIVDRESKRPESHYFTLTMIEMQMGCIGEGSATAAKVMANGHNKP